MTLNSLWFIFIGILYAGFFVLEGFDFGVGILLPFLGKNDLQRRTIINTIGPHWDGNEVWLITAGGATFAAFPEWYATLFSGFYLPLFLILIGLIVRGVAFEFRSKDDHPLWRSFWDWCLCLGSIIPTILFPVAFSNLVRGIPIDANMQYVGGFFYLLNPFALLASFAVTLLIIMHGASFLSLKTTGEIEQKARALVRWLWLLVVLVLLIFLITSVIVTDVRERLSVFSIGFPVVALVAILSAGYFLRKGQFGRFFVMTCITVAFFVFTIFGMLYPRVMVSSLNPEWSLTIQNAASSPYTLKLMTTVTLIFLPIVLIYQAWTYWIFRKRLAGDPKKLTY
ncbi:MAG: cytochrome d ubiquinol oxidase subunit II [Chloroflexi bacterium RBG_19FT_COMBO_50_10]|nr:MAG: cytochrome d ubiquinol oxidase subunit II [Chloroflexi bacterium RBG_19FT_COMBO_50_10]